MGSQGNGRDLRIAGIVAVVALAMVGAAYAAVPLYYAFCRATGFEGTTQVAREAPASDGARTFAVRFDANVAPGLPWRVEPETSEITLRTGATATVFFRFRNLSNHKTSAVAVYNVAPDVAGGWFDKISCFCFNEQHLGPDERTELPVVFFLDPGLEKTHDMDDVHEITLSYTLYAAPDSKAPPVALQPSAAPSASKL